MGYRSDVKIIVGFPTPEARDKFRAVAALEMAHKEWYALLEEATDEFTCLLGHVPRYELWAHFEQVKWYEDYEDVTDFTAWYKQAITDEYRGYYEFCRIGEESDDVEHRLEAHDEMQDGYGGISANIDTETTSTFCD